MTHIVGLVVEEEAELEEVDVFLLLHLVDVVVDVLLGPDAAADHGAVVGLLLQTGVGTGQGGGRGRGQVRLGLLHGWGPGGGTVTENE